MSTHGENSTQSRLLVLDGIRGWGALSVLLFHVFIDCFPISQATTNIIAPLPFFNGKLAVWIFFIVSGFSLSVHFFRTHNRDAVIDMALGRYIRLTTPILIISGLVFLCFQLGLVIDLVNRPVPLQSLLTTTPTFSQTILFAFFEVFFKYEPATTLIPPLWTMPYEFWGSCLILGTLLVIPRKKRRFILYALVALVAYRVNPIYAAFIVGMIFAEIYASDIQQRHRGKFKLITALTLASALLLTFKLPSLISTPYPLYIAAALMSFSLIFNHHAAKFMSGRLSQFLGKISFPLYLIHSPIIYTYSSYLHHVAGSDISDRMKLVINLSTVVVSIIAAYVLIPADQLGIRASKIFARYMRGSGAASIVKSAPAPQ